MPRVLVTLQLTNQLHSRNERIQVLWLDISTLTLLTTDPTANIPNEVA